MRNLSIIQLIFVALCFVISQQKLSEEQQQAYQRRQQIKKESQQVKIFVNNIFPYDNPSETYRYYMLPFCKPEDLLSESQSLGESLSGDRKMNSKYEVQFLQNVKGDKVCQQTITEVDYQLFSHALQEDYYAEFYINDIATHDTLGVYVDENDDVFLKNHIEFNIYIDHKYNIIHANITAPNIERDFIELIPLEQGEEQAISFYYSVNFFEINPEEVQYFDQIETAKIKSSDDQTEIHWLSIGTSFILVLMLVSLVSLVLQKTIRKDLTVSRDLDNEDDVNWKKIRTEALLPPTNKLLLSGFIGTGVQFLFLTICLCILGVLGIYYGHHKGNQKTFGILIFAFTGIFNGFYASKHYKLMGGKHWALTIVTSCCLFPVIMLLVWSVMNSIAWSNDSTAAIPFKSVFFVICMWLLIYVPLTILGGITGRMKNQDDAPNPDFSMPRLYKPLPSKKIYQHPLFQFIVAGLLPFSQIFLELYYVVMSVWGHHVYHLYFTLFIAFLMLIMVHICVSIVMTYFQLNSQDYTWWWRSFINGGSISLFLMLYSIYFYYEKTKMHGLIQGFYYFGYMFLFSVAMFLMMGSISFLVSRRFVNYIYSQAKID